MLIGLLNKFSLYPEYFFPFLNYYIQHHESPHLPIHSILFYLYTYLECHSYVIECCEIFCELHKRKYNIPIGAFKKCVIESYKLNHDLSSMGFEKVKVVEELHTYFINSRYNKKTIKD